MRRSSAFAVVSLLAGGLVAACSGGSSGSFFCAMTIAGQQQCYGYSNLTSDQQSAEETVCSAGMGMTVSSCPSGAVGCCSMMSAGYTVSQCFYSGSGTSSELAAACAGAWSGGGGGNGGSSGSGGGAGTGGAGGGGGTDSGAEGGMDTSMGPDLATLSGFCAARAAAECSSAVVAACAIASATTCEAARVTACTSSVPPGTTYQPAQAEACLSAVTATYATATITAAAVAAEASACGPALFAGPGAVSAPCSKDYDCNSALMLRCVFPSPPAADMRGECLVPVPVAPGGDCSALASVCATGTYCDPAAHTCHADGQTGQGCSAPSYPCAPGLACQGVGPFATCGAGGGQQGDACHADPDCIAGLCDVASGQTVGKCEASITLGTGSGMCATFDLSSTRFSRRRWT